MCIRDRRGITEWEPNPRGGATLCQIVVKTGKESSAVIAYGATECGDHSFSYKGGRGKAKFRTDLALKLMRMLEQDQE